MTYPLPVMLKLRSPITPAALLLALLAGGSGAQEPPPSGSPTFCLFEVPASGERKQWINLVHVQYIEQRADELRIYYGGGNFGGGHEVRLPVHGRDEAAQLVKRLQDAARACR